MNLAVLKFSALGDIAASLPVLRALTYSPTIITSPMGKALLEDEFDNFLVLSNKKTISLIQLIVSIRKNHFDWLIDLQNNDRSKLITYLASAQIANHNNVSFDQNITNILYDIAKKTNLTKELDYTFQPKEKSYIVLNCGSSPKWISKRLPFQERQEISSLLYEKYGLPFILTGDRTEETYIQEVAKYIVGPKEIVVGKTTLLELKHILTHAFLTISTDSAPMHISAVQKTPTIGLFGPTNWMRSAPFGPWSTVIYDKQFYKDDIPPQKSLSIINNYFDTIDISSALVKLQKYIGE
ncbi:MAG: glycosyltransferase family 9 protein [Campylobacteraceae bacterium]|nr:glycosyltransferase family 9 protein [Campylobacteraceae bacterium]